MTKYNWLRKYQYIPTRYIIVMAALVMVLMAGCKKSVVVPPINAATINEQLPGKFIWYDLFTTDIEASAAFYGSLFGWELKKPDASYDGVLSISNENTLLGNMVLRRKEGVKSKWLAYMSVVDVPASVERAIKHGGSVHVAPKKHSNLGQVAVVLDPQGAGFALLDSSSGDPVDTPRSANTWLGAELWTTDVPGAIQFYEALVGYEVSTKQLSNGKEYTLLASQGRPRAGVAQAPWKDLKPEWIPYVAVDDIQSVLQQAKALGGRVLLSPDMTIKEGRVALVVDPSGAVFGLQQLR